MYRTSDICLCVVPEYGICLAIVASLCTYSIACYVGRYYKYSLMTKCALTKCCVRLCCEVPLYSQLSQ